MLNIRFACWKILQLFGGQETDQRGQDECKQTKEEEDEHRQDGEEDGSKDTGREV